MFCDADTETSQGRNTVVWLFDKGVSIILMYGVH